MSERLTSDGMPGDADASKDSVAVVVDVYAQHGPAKEEKTK